MVMRSLSEKKAAECFNEHVMRNFKKMEESWSALLAKTMAYLQKIATFIDVKCADQEDIWSSLETTFVMLTNLKVDKY